MKSIKKLWLIFLSTALILSGCGNTKKATKSAEEFDEFVDSLVVRLLEPTDLDLNYLFLDPASYGIEQGVYELPFTSYEEALEIDELYNDLRSELKEFDYKQLSDSQKLTYDVLTDAFSEGLNTKTYYLISMNYLGSYLGYQAQLPLLLMEYTFNNQQDITSYFNVLETMEDTFVEYVKLEKERQTAGVGMSQVIIDKVIEQCHNITAEEESFLVEIINTKIDGLTFLSDSQKQEYKDKNTTLLNNEYMNAYQRLADELSSIDSSIEDTGLVGLPNGKDYYSYLVKANTGTDMTVEELRKFAETHFNQYVEELYAILAKNPSIYETFISMDLSSVTYTNQDNFEAVLDDLAKKMLTDYPDIGELYYEVSVVPDAMKDNFSPAAYLTGKVDASLTTPERIFINGEFSQSLYTTLAHEGYPGHMYQNAFFRQTGAPTVHYLFGYGAYTEGWATYIENRAWMYADVDTEDDLLVLELVELNSKLTQMLTIQMDIGVHYDGWSRDDLKEFIIQNFGEQADESIYDSQYDLILETPANTLKYYVGGAIFDDLYQKASKELGNKFSSVEFNRVLLTCGPSPFSVVESAVDQYINDNK